MTIQTFPFRMWDERVCPITTEQIPPDDQQIRGRNIQSESVIRLQRLGAPEEIFRRNVNQRRQGPKNRLMSSSLVQLD